MSKNLRTDFKTAIQHYESHPVDFVREVLHADLDPWQIEAFDKLVNNHFLAIRSGNGVGKTAFLAMALLWFISTKPHSKIPTTAPSQHQLYDILWSECYKWMTRSKFLENLLHWTKTGISVKGYEPVWYAVARTAAISPNTDIAEGLQGFHTEDNLLFIVDEASGVQEPVFNAMVGAFTGQNAYCILAANPTRSEGFFYEIFNNLAIGRMFINGLLHVSSEDSPRVSKEWIQLMLDRYGREHPIFHIKVLGNFPSKDLDLLIPPSFVEAMQHSKMDMTLSPKMHTELGVDVGRVKAASVLAVRQGTNVLEFAEKYKPGQVSDTLEVAQWITGYINDYDPQFVKIDAIGIGAGVFDILHAMWGDRIVPVIGSARAVQSDRYLNARAEGYWNLRDRISNIYCKSWPDRLITELSDIKQMTTRNGKVQVESKMDMRQRSLRSPDYADALMYSFYSDTSQLPEEPYVFPSIITDINNSLVSDSRPSSGSVWITDKYASLSSSKWRSLN